MNSNILPPLRKTFSSKRFQGYWIPIVFFFVSLVIVNAHDSFKEWDGVLQYFAGRAILSGNGYTGWASHFWPPLYSILIGMGSVFYSGFWVGKMISLLSATVLLTISFHLTYTLTENYIIGQLTQLFIALNPQFMLESMQAQNHMLDAMFFVGGIYVFILAIENKSLTISFLAGLVCGLAGLTRYTSYSLIVLGIGFFFLTKPKNAFKLMILFFVGFAVISTPWWIYNTVQNGSPLYTWQYLNIGSAVVPQHGGWRQWWWDGQTQFHSLWGIIAAYPAAYCMNILHSVIQSTRILIISSGVLAPFVVPGIIWSLYTGYGKKLWIILSLQLVFFVLLISQAFTIDYILLPWIIVLVIFSVRFLVELPILLQKRFHLFNRKYLLPLALLILVFYAGNLAYWQCMNYINDRTSGGKLSDFEEVAAALGSYDSHIKGKCIMAVHPSRAYYVGSKYLATPLYYNGSIDSMVNYQGLSSKVRESAPKYPPTMNNRTLHADYFIYSINDEDLSRFRFLLDPTSPSIPPGFTTVYRSKNTAVYAIEPNSR